VPFSSLLLHPDLLRGIKELGFTRPTPIQADAIPPALAGRDVLACAQTGSGKTAAFLLPILHQLMDKPRRTTRTLILTPTRELAAQILADLNDLSVHTPITGAAVFGGVGMGPQEPAFRRGVDGMIATPGRLPDHFKAPDGQPPGTEFLVLDEADRMLDMGFLPDIKRILKHVPAKRQTLFFSATMPAPIMSLVREMLKDPVLINLERQSKPAVGITQALYPVAQELKSTLLLTLLQRGEMQEVLVFTRTKHRANRLHAFLSKHGIPAERIHGNRSAQGHGLTLSAGKLMRIALQQAGKLCLVHAHVDQRLQGAQPPFSLKQCRFMHQQALFDDSFHRHARRQRGKRVLEHHLHLLAQGPVGRRASAPLHARCLQRALVRQQT